MTIQSLPPYELPTVAPRLPSVPEHNPPVRYYFPANASCVLHPAICRVARLKSIMDKDGNQIMPHPTIKNAWSFKPSANTTMTTLRSFIHKHIRPAMRPQPNGEPIAHVFKGVSNDRKLWNVTLYVWLTAKTHKDTVILRNGPGLEPSH